RVPGGFSCGRVGDESVAAALFPETSGKHEAVASICLRAFRPQRGIRATVSVSLHAHRPRAKLRAGDPSRRAAWRSKKCANPLMNNLDVLFTPAEFEALKERDLRDTICVVFDVLRATSSMVTALANGAKEIIPVEEIAEALAERA